MPFTIEITTTDAEMEDRILKAVARELDLVLRHAAPAIRADIADLADELIRGTPAYASLLGGELMGELGLADPKRRMDAVLAAIKAGVQVWVEPVRVAGRKLDGGLVFGLLRENYSEILDLAEASYISQVSGSEIPWLGWLVGGGDRIIVFNYDVQPVMTAAQRARSRSKKALMFKGKGWRVPPEFSGSFSDNFLTRAFDVPGVEAALDAIVRNQIEKRL